MPYVKRNGKGEIIELHNFPTSENDQWLELTDSGIQKFLHTINSSEQAKQALSSTDIEMARVVDDLIDLLMEKQMFIFTELPEAVQAKLNTRKQLRQDLTVLGDLIDDDSIF